MSVRAAWPSALLALALVACGDERSARTPAPPHVEAACPTEHGDKVGVPFVRVCGEAAPDATWIAAAPLGCSQGEHESMACPLATPMLAEPELPAATLAPRPAALADSFTAHRICAMRFGGRLPTSAERLALRARQGLSAFVASTAGGAGVHLAELSEWVEDGDCGNPSLPGPTCRPSRTPGVSSRTSFDWASIQRCELAPAGGGAAAPVSLGDRCAGPACVLRSPWQPTLDSAPRLVAVRCAGAPHPEHAAPAPDVAAFRCVLPRAALTPSR